MIDFKRSLETLEIVGGALCFDFVNTINSRRSPEHDYLSSYIELSNWGNKVGVLSDKQQSRLQKQAKHDVKAAERALKRALEIRELLYRLFSNLSKGSKPNKNDLNLFIQMYGEAISLGEFVKTGEHFVANWEMDKTYDSILCPVIYSAGKILLSKELAQVKECPSCGWLFLDTSKNQSRRWCSMNTCGARDKMRRYHRKLRIMS